LNAHIFPGALDPCDDPAKTFEVVNERPVAVKNDLNGSLMPSFVFCDTPAAKAEIHNAVSESEHCSRISEGKRFTGILRCR
jgi:hypothetical protein